MNRVHGWLQKLYETRGSDLFVTAGLPPSLKIDGVIQPIEDAALTADETKQLVFSIMNSHQSEEFENTRECQFAVALNDDARFRISAFYQQGCIGIVCRLIETRIPQIEELGMPQILVDLAMEKRGIIFFVGATGSGKSTSLAAMVGLRNQAMTGHIITIEDPIEFVHKHAKSMITQREVGVDTESFDVALRNTLRQAPDVILIGEIRTRESMQHALTFAETGHLCLCTLHANNANQAMDRILHFFPEDERDQVLLDLSFNLKAIIAQQLLPSIDGGRRWAAVEVLINTPLMQQKIRQGDIHELKDIMKRSGHLGMMTFDECLFNMYMAERISYEEGMRHADSKNEFRLQVKLAKGGSAEELAKTLEGVNLVDD